jgi:hypothetical protein
VRRPLTVARVLLDWALRLIPRRELVCVLLRLPKGDIFTMMGMIATISVLAHIPPAEVRMCDIPRLGLRELLCHIPPIILVDHLLLQLPEAPPPTPDGEQNQDSLLLTHNAFYFISLF